MIRPKCAVKSCNNNAFVSYGGTWVCGNCMVKIINQKKEEQLKEIEELGV